MSCSKYQGFNLLYKPCLYVTNIASGNLWRHLLWRDYCSLLALAVIVVLACYMTYRRGRWQRLCRQHTGLWHDDGTDPKTGKPLHSYVKIRSHRRYGLGELLGVYIHGLDTCTETNVSAAKEAIEIFAGTAFGDPRKIDQGWHNSKIYLPVSGLVKKKLG